jgi:FMN phosphatase YigB (HAD superfamily)
LTEQPRRPPRFVTVDLWHTLLEVDRRTIGPLALAREQGWTAALERRGVPGPSALRAVRVMRREAERTQASGRSVPIRAQARLLWERTGVAVPPEEVASVIGAAALRTKVRLAPSALPALDWLAGSGVRLGLVSNILSEPPEAIHRMMDRTRLSDRFDSVYLSAEHRYAKPSPRPFRAVLAALGGRPGEALHIGDHSDDVVGARSAGLPVVRYTGLLKGYPREPARALARIPGEVPALAAWSRLRAGWPGLVERARAVPPSRPRSATRGRSARAG